MGPGPRSGDASAPAFSLFPAHLIALRPEWFQLQVTEITTKNGLNNKSISLSYGGEWFWGRC